VVQKWARPKKRRPCSPCQFEYNYILHIENAAEESEFLFQELDIVAHLPDHTHRTSSSDKTHPAEWFFQNVSRKTVENIYRKYYVDFVTLGYS